jgi:hypothetical protein
MIINVTEDAPRTERERHAHITGWGADLDHADRPAYPMERTPPRLPYPAPQPDQQHSHAEVLVSTERPRITRVYGTAQPPKGLSGWLRRQAFRHSENDLRRWLMLLLADRVNVGEGLVEDLASGHVPNLYAEMGGRAELKHNPKGAARKAAIGLAAVALLAVALQRQRARRRAGLR